MSLERERDVLVRAIEEAGRAVRDRVARGLDVREKDGRSPVTAADLEADRVLRAALLGAFPADAWLSEETEDEPGRATSGRVWIVDPIDGTRELVRGRPEYAISVALAAGGRPLLAAVLNPATGELFLGEEGRGVSLNGRPVAAAHPFEGRPVLLASRSENRRGLVVPFEPHAEIRLVGSIAYKLALLAAGRADAIVSRAPKNLWDVAAGALLVTEAGGVVTDLHRRPLAFDHPYAPIDGLIATTRAAHRPIQDLLDALGLHEVSP